MARLVSERDESGIRLLTLEISDGEIFTCIQILRHTLQTLEPDGIETLTGAYPDEVEGMLEDLQSMINQAEWDEDAAPAFASAG